MFFTDQRWTTLSVFCSGSCFPPKTSPSSTWVHTGLSADSWWITMLPLCTKCKCLWLIWTTASWWHLHISVHDYNMLHLKLTLHSPNKSSRYQTRISPNIYAHDHQARENFVKEIMQSARIGFLNFQAIPLDTYATLQTLYWNAAESAQHSHEQL